MEALENPGWALEEFERAPFPDHRLIQRAVVVAADFARHPGAPIPQACFTEARMHGAYRFIENEMVRPQQMLIGHRQASLQRWAREPLVLAPADTTSFNFGAHPETEGLGDIGTKAHPQAQGLWLHSTLTFSATGLPLGLVSARFWARLPEPGPRLARHRRPFEQKESVRWRESWKACRGALAQLPQPNLWVNITDMEGDIYEVFAAAQSQPTPRVEVLVRSRHDRKLKDQEQRLWDHLAAQPLGGMYQVPVPRHEHQPPRQASLEVRFSEVLLEAPSRKRGQQPLRLWAVEAREAAAPQGVEPILWRLLSTLEVSTTQQAIEKVHWYSMRWGIEVFHKTLKSVCHAEDPQLQTAQRLERVLMLDMIVAWRINVLTMVGRQHPQMPANEIFAESEWKALHSYVHRDRIAPTRPPNLGDMTQWIGRLGGFVKCKATPHPGPITMARGLARLNDLAEMWALQNTPHAKIK